MASWGSKRNDTDPTDEQTPKERAEQTKEKPEDIPIGKQAPLMPNRETANEPDQLVNPHNTALGQRPVENAEKKIQEAEEWLRDTHLGKLQEWKRRVFLGGPRQGDWEEFDALMDDGVKTERARRSGTSTTAKKAER